jgi:hypothetical protein
VQEIYSYGGRKQLCDGVGADESAPYGDGVGADESAPYGDGVGADESAPYGRASAMMRWT